MESKSGTWAMWMPNTRSPRYAVISGMAVVPMLIALIEMLLKFRTLTGAAIVIVFVICAAVAPISIARGSSLVVTRDFVLKGSPRRPSRKIPRANVVLVRYRGEFGELIGENGKVLLQTSPLLTRRQVNEVADYLHVPFSGNMADAPVVGVQDSPGVFVLRPDKGKAVKFRLLIGLLAVVGLGGGVFDMFNGFRGAAIYTSGMFLVLFVGAVIWYRSTALVVTDDAVYKGPRAGGSKFAARAEIAEIVYGPRLVMNAANGATLLTIDTSLFTATQAEELAYKLDIPIRRDAKATKSRSK